MANFGRKFGVFGVKKCKFIYDKDFVKDSGLDFEWNVVVSPTYIEILDDSELGVFDTYICVVENDKRFLWLEAKPPCDDAIGYIDCRLPVEPNGGYRECIIDSVNYDIVGAAHDEGESREDELSDKPAMFILTLQHKEEGKKTPALHG